MGWEPRTPNARQLLKTLSNNVLVSHFLNAELLYSHLESPYFTKFIHLPGYHRLVILTYSWGKTVTQ